MKRKGFIQNIGAIAGLAAVSPLAASVGTGTAGLTAPIIPPYLKKGDTIGITSPAGYITLEEIKPAIQVLELWGYRVKIGDTIGKRNFTFGGTDEERKNDLQQMLDDKNIKAVLCARGGYGAVRIVDQLNWTAFKHSPKWVIGFSDITVLHCHINRNMGIASIHSKMCNSFPSVWANADAVQRDTINSIQQALSGITMQYKAIPHPANRSGTASGVLVGGNLKTIESLAASPSDLRTGNKILFVEDTGEYMYSMDRMFWNLQRSGKLENLKGLIVGGFKEKKEEGDDEFGKTLQDVVLEKVKQYNYPVCFDFPVGHQRNNYALKCGVMHRLIVNTNEVSLKEI